MRLTTILLALVIPAVAVPLLAHAMGGGGERDLAPSATQAMSEGGLWHEVRPGEDLRSIARIYYGSARHWRTVQLANDVGMTPSPGRSLWVPGRMPELP